MSLESAYLLGGEREDICEKLREKGWDKYPILILKIKNNNGSYEFAGVEEKSIGSLQMIIPTKIGGREDPYLPCLIAKVKLKFNKKDNDNKKSENIQKFCGEITKKLDKIKNSMKKMSLSQYNSIANFGKSVLGILKDQQVTQKKKEIIRSVVIDRIVKWAEKLANNDSKGVNAFILCVALDDAFAEELSEVDDYLSDEYQKRSKKHSGMDIEGEGRCAWCGEIKKLTPRMDYWKPGNIDNSFSAPFGRKEETYKVIPICSDCHARLIKGMKILNDKYSSALGGGVHILYAPRILYSYGRKINENLKDDVQEFYIQLREEIMNRVQMGTSQLSRIGEKVISLRGAATTVEDLADMLERESLTFDVTWLKRDQSAETVLTRAYDVVPTWLLKLAEITDRANNTSQNSRWSTFAASSGVKFVLEGKHFWSLFPQPDKGKEQRQKKTKTLKTLNLPWVVASEVLEKRIRCFYEYLPDFFAGVDAHWCNVNESERIRIFKTGSEKTKIFQWVSLWHKFSYYVYLLRKEAGIMENSDIAGIDKSGSVGTTAISNNETIDYPRKIIDAAIQEADEAKIYKTKTEKGAFLAGIALGMLAIYQNEDRKSMRVLDYPGDYRLEETAYKQFMLRFGDKLRDYLYVKDFRETKGSIVQGLLGASIERTGGGFENLTPEAVGFAVLSGILRAGHYYYMPGDKKKQKEGGKK